LEPLERAGAILELAATFAQLRQAGVMVDENFQSNIANNRGHFDRDAISAYILNTVGKLPPQASEFSKPIFDGLVRIVSDDALRLQVVGDTLDANKSLPLIDESLSILGAYMVARGIPFPPLPSAT
jgi:hypothetical protein